MFCLAWKHLRTLNVQADKTSLDKSRFYWSLFGLARAKTCWKEGFSSVMKCLRPQNCKYCLSQQASEAGVLFIHPSVSLQISLLELVNQIYVKTMFFICQNLSAEVSVIFHWSSLSTFILYIMIIFGKKHPNVLTERDVWSYRTIKSQLILLVNCSRLQKKQSSSNVYFNMNCVRGFLWLANRSFACQDLFLRKTCTHFCVIDRGFKLLSERNRTIKNTFTALFSC